jgi:cation transporter-like permease
VSECGPSFAATVFSVYIAGAVTSAIAGQLISRLLVGHIHARMSSEEVRNIFISSEIISVLPSALVSALIVWLILSFDPGAPTFVRVFVAMVIGAAVATAFRTYMVIDLIGSPRRARARSRRSQQSSVR